MLRMVLVRYTIPMNIITYIITLLSLAIIDAGWLYITGSQYRVWLGHLFAPTFNFIPAVVFYLLYTAGVVFFAVSPALKSGASLGHVFFVGALLGLFAYGTYDLTNNATMRDWPIIVTIIDMAWGALLTGGVSTLVVLIYRSFFA